MKNKLNTIIKIIFGNQAPSFIIFDVWFLNNIIISNIKCIKEIDKRDLNLI